MQMQMRPELFPTMSPLLLFSISTFLILIHNFPMCHGVDDERFTNCSRSDTCANREISYPFWGGDRQAYCGHPGFELNCSGDAPEITMASLSYRVLAIDISAKTLTLVRNDYWQNLCPPSYANVTLDFSILSYASNTKNVSLYYECPALPSTGVSLQINLTQFDCRGNINYYLTPDIAGNTVLAAFAAYLSSCKSTVRVPGIDSRVNELQNNINTTEEVLQVLNDGFGLVWDANNTECQRCTGSGGTCGSQADTTEFTCYCPGGPFATACNGTSPTTADKKKSDVPLGVGLGIAGAGITGLGLGFLFFRYRQRRKQLDAEAKSKDLSTPPSTKGIPTPTTQFTRSIPSFPSSNTDFAKSNYFGVQVFDYTELEEATDNFNPSRELGDGGFGTVYYGNLLDGRVVAVKRLYENNFKRVEQFMNEVEILTRLRHKNLVVLFGCTSRKSRELLLVYEYIPNGTVADHLHGSKSNSGLLTWSVRLSIAIETADALAYLHASDIIHRDVKTNNILLDNDFRVKVADFGLSRLFPTDVTHVSTAPQGTPGYVDPEYYQCYQLTDKSDVYSFGVVLMELISSKPAVDTNRHRHDINLANMAVNKIQNHTLHELVEPSLGFETDYVVKRMTTAVAELAFRCLQQEKDMRPSMEEVLEGLRAIQNEDFSVQKAEVVDIRVDEDAGLLKNIPNPPPLSPDSAATDKWVSSSTTPNSF